MATCYNLCMTLATTNLMTAEMLEVLPHQGRRLELVRGELRELMPTGFEHGEITHRLSSRLGVFVEDNNLGVVCSAETGFIVDRNPDTVRAPDIAFVSQERLEMLGGAVRGFAPLAPDLAVETISPSDSYTESHEKALMWLEFGSQLVLLLDPRKAQITVYRSKKDISVLENDDLLDLHEVVQGFQMPLSKIFRR
jgi:Uma2 family endonuclease